MPLHDAPLTCAHGPCERCGVAFTVEATVRPAQCPNCGHRDVGSIPVRRERKASGGSRVPSWVVERVGWPVN